MLPWRRSFLSVRTIVSQPDFVRSSSVGVRAGSSSHAERRLDEKRTSDIVELVHRAGWSNSEHV